MRFCSLGPLPTTKSVSESQIALIRASCRDQRKISERVADLKEESILWQQAKINKQHNNHKLTARERISILLDEHSFVEFD
jgi:acetyl-CoA carboxylase carboxyltransferase component